MTFEYHTKPFPHQSEEFDKIKDLEKYAIFWEQGCVDAETEYLTPSGWRRIDRYNGGPVMQYHADTKKGDFIEPLKYVKLPCEVMWHLYTRSVDQMMTEEHRILHTRKFGGPSMVKSAREIFDEKIKIFMPHTFKSDMIGEGCGLSEWELRFKVMLIVQGKNLTKGMKGSTYVLIKNSWPEDREDRLIRILRMNNIHYKVIKVLTVKGNTKYRIDTTTEDFDVKWWTKVNNADREIIIDEAMRWSINDNRRVHVKKKCNAEFLQYMGCTLGGHTYQIRKQHLGWMVERSVNQNKQIVPDRDIYPDVASDGFKYCFEVPSGFLVLRRRGKVFITGNTGKSKLNIDNFQYLYDKGEVNSLFIVAPNGVHRNWITDELPAHLPPKLWEKSLYHFYESKKSKTKKSKQAADDIVNNRGLSILAMSYEGFMTKAGKKLAWDFLTKRKCYYVLDEGQKIKSPGAKRTKSIVASGKYAKYKRVLSGTLGVEGPFDMYAPIKFLDPGFWKKHHLGTFAAFKSFFGVYRRRQEVIDNQGYDPGFDQLLSYKNLDKLRELVQTISSRVTKESAGLGLPPKLYQKLYFDMNPEQRSAYNELREEYMTQVDDELITAELPIVRLMRLQQITCGYAQIDSDEPIRLIGKTNPRLDASIAHLEGGTHQSIIWARFRHDNNQLMDALGKDAVRYDGRLTAEESANNLEAFKRGDVKHFVANQQKGATGLTVVNATESFYYSNYFSLELRLQSEDRNHRIGQHNSVMYTDAVCPNTVDDHIADALRNKYDIASQIRGDDLKEWM